MQHELLCSKLRPATEGSSLLEMVKGSSSGETPHRAASMELIFERSIREHKERIVAAGAKELKPQSSPEKKESKPQSPPAKPPPTDKKPVKVQPAPENPKKRESKRADGLASQLISDLVAVIDGLKSVSNEA